MTPGDGALHSRLLAAAGRVPLWPLALLGLLLAARGVAFDNDSSGYIDGVVIRSAGYPLLLDLLQLLFGEAAMSAAMVLQIGMGLAAAASLALYVRRALAAGRWSLWLLLALLLLPYYGPLGVGNRILSEGLAYPLFLVAMRCLFAALLERRLRPFIIACLVTGAATLTRQQLAFLYPVLGLVALCLFARRRSWRVLLLAAGSLLVALVGGELTERTYHLARHGAFVRAPFSGVQLLSVALYVADEQDTALLRAADRELFATLHRRGKDLRLLHDANPSPGGIASYAWHYRQVYNEIVYRLLLPELAERARKRHLGDTDWIAAERRLAPMALHILAGHQGRLARLYVANILSGMGFYYALFLAVVTPMAVYQGLRCGQQSALVLAAATTTHLANYVLIAGIQAVRLRYTFYTDGLVLALLVICLAAAWRRDADAVAGTEPAGPSPPPGGAPGGARSRQDSR